MTPMQLVGHRDDPPEYSHVHPASSVESGVGASGAPGTSPFSSPIALIRFALFQHPWHPLTLTSF